jgi:hypothetical protein
MRASWKKYYKVTFADRGGADGRIGVLAGAVHDVGETVARERAPRIRRPADSESALIDSAEPDRAQGRLHRPEKQPCLDRRVDGVGHNVRCQETHVFSHSAHSATLKIGLQWTV